MARAIAYKDAIRHMVRNFDTSWAEDDDEIGTGLSCEAVMVADIYGKTDEQVKADTRKERPTA